jgi:DNA helicase II / ATP-dependent DNA helicase PcrA
MNMKDSISNAKKLNQPQLEAINHDTGPLLVIAGAGTGKTTVITERIKKLIADKKADPSEILALTFTEKAATEMETRIDEVMPLGYTQIWVMTFHSFCDRILRDEGLHIGLSSDYKLITATDIVDLIRRHIFEFNLNYFRPLGNPYKFISAMVSHFDRLRDEDVTPENYRVWAESLSDDKDQYLELSSAFAKYQELKIAHNFLDFSDLISFTLLLFRTRPHLLKKYQNKFKYFLVDEFQDTNYSQNQLINLLAGPGQNLMVVADDDQSIYHWRGAATSNVLLFRQSYVDTKTIVLTDNYRSSQTILDSAYRLIQYNNPDRLEVAANISKQLKAHSKNSINIPEFMHFDRGEYEADGVAQKIKELIASDPAFSYRDFAILVRANNHASAFIQSLNHFGLPNQFLGPGKLFDQPEIKDLIAYLNVIRDFTDNQSLFRVLSMDYFSLDQKEIIELSNMAHKTSRTFFSLCESSENKEISKIVNIINHHLESKRTLSAGEILFDFLSETGMLSAILNLTPPFDPETAGSVTQFFNKIKSFSSDNKDSSVESVLNWLELSSEIGESPAVANGDWTQNNAVNILTVHSSKGLEFPVVFLVNLVSQRFPSTERREPLPIPDALIKEVLPSGDFHLQEERRLFYVAMTRAKSRLFLTAADFYGDAKRIKKLSPFITEALGNSALEPSSHVAIQPSLLDWQRSKSPPTTYNLQPTTISYLSYSQIQTFRDCPLHYKAKYIYKMSSPPSAASSFGNTIHKTLRDYHDLKRQHLTSDIQDLYSHNWIPEGYRNAKHAQMYFDKGKNYLTSYLQSDLAQKDPVLLEEPFTIALDGLKIGGKIDRVDLLPDGGIEIVDYKTSTKFLTEKEAITNLQLSFYALAANLIPTSPFNLPPEKITLTLYYLDEQKKVSVRQTPAQLEAAKEEIYQAGRDIAASDFHCSGSLICQHSCDFKILCDIDRN